MDKLGGVKYTYHMKIEWDEKKNQLLKKGRGVSFEDVQQAIENNDYEILENSSKKHPSQYILLVQINDYPHVVPFELRENKIRLITVFPDRRMKK